MGVFLRGSIGQRFAADRAGPEDRKLGGGHHDRDARRL